MLLKRGLGLAPKPLQLCLKSGLGLRAQARITQIVDSSKPIRKRRGNFLPHWEQEGAFYSITFRLADSLPEEAVERLEFERRQLSREFELTGKFEHAEDLDRLRKLMSSAFEKLLDECRGECLLRNDANAALVADALRHFDGDRYKLIAWCIMPNHVHVIVQPRQGVGLEKLMHSWKSFTAQAIQKLSGHRGSVWQREYFDHLIRSEAELEWSINYVLDNPREAGLKGWKWLYLATDYIRYRNRDLGHGGPSHA